MRRIGGVWWSTPEFHEALPPPPINDERASPQEAGPSPCMHAGVLVGSGRESEGLTRYAADGPGCRAAVSPQLSVRRGRAAGREAAVLRASEEGNACDRRTPAPLLDPSSFSLPHLHGTFCTTRAPGPLFIWTLYFTFVLCLDTILLIKRLSGAYHHSHCVCRWLHPSQWWRMRARRSLDGAVGGHRLTSSHLARGRSYETGLGQKPDAIASQPQ